MLMECDTCRYVAVLVHALWPKEHVWYSCSASSFSFSFFLVSDLFHTGLL